MVLDAARFSDNAYFIKAREEAYAFCSIPDKAFLWWNFSAACFKSAMPSADSKFWKSHNGFATSPPVSIFLEKELWQLHHELKTKTYESGGYHHFLIFEPKKRVISAAPYRDQMVHHAIHNVLEPIFNPTFIHDSYATRQDKGTHITLDRFQQFAKGTQYVLKCDIRQ